MAEQNDKSHIERLTAAIARAAQGLGREVRLMEVCGTHTVAIFRQGIRSVLPRGVRLLSGPGCPVCVTSVRDVDTAIAISKSPGTVLCTFGDMMRVPGGEGSLFDAKAEGADIRIVYSPLDALRAAKDAPERRVVFFATGFETTSPLVAATIMQARAEGIKNFSAYCVHKLVPPALSALLSSGEVRIDGFILPGHVCSITGTAPFEFLATDHGAPATVTGFGAVDILEGILLVMDMLLKGRPEVNIQYSKIVKPEGNPQAQLVLGEVFEPADAYWRGIGEIPMSGLVPSDVFAAHDAARVFDGLKVPDHPEPRGCSCGEVLKGIKLPTDCPLFGKRCTPDKPVGACMVSTEGSCAAYYKYGGA